MFTSTDLSYESDLHEAIETLPEGLESVYVPLYWTYLTQCSFLKIREDTLTTMRRRQDHQPTYRYTNFAVDVSSRASVEKM